MNVQEYINREVNQTIIIDFDGTIIKQSSTLVTNFLDEPPISGVKEGLDSLKNLGFTLKLWSCRTSSIFSQDYRRTQKQLMEEYCKKWKLPIDEVLDLDKPFAKAYIDDLNLIPDWNNILERIKEVPNYG